MASIPFIFILDFIEPDFVSSSNIFYFVPICLWWFYSILDYATGGDDRYPEYVVILWLVVLGFLGLALLFGLMDGIFGGGSSSFDSDYEQPSRYW